MLMYTGYFCIKNQKISKDSVENMPLSHKASSFQKENVFLSLINCSFMRIALVFLFILSGLLVKSQSFLRPALTGYTPIGIGARTNVPMHIPAGKKWFMSSSASVMAGMGFYRGGNSTFIAAPLSLQLNRRINDNLYGFGAVTVAPVYSNFSGTFLSADLNKLQGQNYFNSFRPGFYSRAEMGLYYINDSRTFSISGSIGIERSSFPMMPYYPYRPVNNPTQSNR